MQACPSLDMESTSWRPPASAEWLKSMASAFSTAALRSESKPTAPEPQALFRTPRWALRRERSGPQSPRNRMARRDRVDGYRNPPRRIRTAKNHSDRRMLAHRKGSRDCALACLDVSHRNACDCQRDWVARRVIDPVNPSASARRVPSRSPTPDHPASSTPLFLPRGRPR